MPVWFYNNSIMYVFLQKYIGILVGFFLFTFENSLHELIACCQLYLIWWWNTLSCHILQSTSTCGMLVCSVLWIAWKNKAKYWNQRICLYAKPLSHGIHTLVGNPWSVSLVYLRVSSFPFCFDFCLWLRFVSIRRAESCSVCACCVGYSIISLILSQ